MGLERRYKVTKLTNPTKMVEGIFLEFDDPIAHRAMIVWAYDMHQAGHEVLQDVLKKIDENVPEDFELEDGK